MPPDATQMRETRDCERVETVRSSAVGSLFRGRNPKKRLHTCVQPSSNQPVQQAREEAEVVYKAYLIDLIQRTKRAR